MGPKDKLFMIISDKSNEEEAEMKKIVVFLICLAVLAGSGCYVAKLGYGIKGDTVNSFYVVDTPFETAFAKATETAIEKGLMIANSDQAGGRFSAVNQGTAFGAEVTTMSFLITKETDGRLKCTISLKSSLSNQDRIDDFKAAYGKKVKISE